MRVGGVSTANVQLSCESILVLSSAMCIHLRDCSLSRLMLAGQA